MPFAAAASLSHKGRKAYGAAALQIECAITSLCRKLVYQHVGSNAFFCSIYRSHNSQMAFFSFVCLRDFCRRSHVTWHYIVKRPKRKERMWRVPCSRPAVFFIERIRRWVVISYYCRLNQNQALVRRWCCMNVNVAMDPQQMILFASSASYLFCFNSLKVPWVQRFFTLWRCFFFVSGAKIGSFN